jgi:hypothetical protein
LFLDVAESVSRPEVDRDIDEMDGAVQVVEEELKTMRKHKTAASLECRRRKRRSAPARPK